jgi:hypothetical protein
MAALHVIAGVQSGCSLGGRRDSHVGAGFFHARWLETNPMTAVSQQRKLLQALDELGM